MALPLVQHKALLKVVKCQLNLANYLREKMQRLKHRLHQTQLLQVQLISRMLRRNGKNLYSLDKSLSKR